MFSFQIPYYIQNASLSLSCSSLIPPYHVATTTNPSSFFFLFTCSTLALFLQWHWKFRFWFWNALSLDICSSPNVSSLKCSLKHQLFKNIWQYYYYYLWFRCWGKEENRSIEYFKCLWKPCFAYHSFKMACRFAT